MNYAVILAGGTGSRAGDSLPKQFQIVKGKRLFWWSVQAFREFDEDCRIILVVHKEYLKDWDMLFGKEEREFGYPVTKVEGGSSRFYSVSNALSIIDDPSAVVFIHDGARPLVTPDLIRRGADIVSKGRGAVPVVPLVDSIRKLTPEGSVSVSRSDYVAVQTPQIFYVEDIKGAYEAAEDDNGFTDDASVAEFFGLGIEVFPGDTDNIKITNPEDFKRL